MALAKQERKCHPERPYYALGFCMACYQKYWRDIDREAYRAWDRKYHNERYKYLPLAKRRGSPERLLLKMAKYRAKKYNLDFDLSLEDIKIPSMCPVLGIPLVPFSGRCSRNSPTIDRIDSSRGYVKDNILVVSFRANSLKNNATVDELRRIADFYTSL